MGPPPLRHGHLSIPLGCGGKFPAPTRRMFGRARSLWAAIERRRVRLVAVDKVDRVIGLLREGEVAHERPGWGLTLDMRAAALAVGLGVKKLADADFRIDLIG